MSAVGALVRDDHHRRTNHDNLHVRGYKEPF